MQRFFGKILCPKEVPKTDITISQYADSKMTSFTIPEDTVRIEAYAFENSCIEEITIPASVRFLGVCAFAFCEKLKSFTLLSADLHMQQNVLYKCSPALTVHLPCVRTKQDIAPIKQLLSSCTDYAVCAPHAPFTAFPVECRSALIRGYVTMCRRNIPIDGPVLASYKKHLHTRLRTILPSMLSDTDMLGILLKAAEPSLQEVNELLDIALQEENPAAHAALLVYRRETFTDHDFDLLEEAEERKTEELLDILEDAGSERWYRRVFPTNAAGNSVIEYRGFDSVVEFPQKIGKKKIVSLAIHPDPVPNAYAAVTSLTIPCGYQKLSPYALKGLTSLKNLTLPTSIETFSPEAFFYTEAEQEQLGKSAKNPVILDILTLTADGLKHDTVWDMLLSPSKYIYYRKLEFSGRYHSLPDYLHPKSAFLTEIVLPEGLRKIGRGSFLRLSKLEKINIPATLTDIGGGFLSACEHLKEVVVSPDNDTVTLTEDGFLISGNRLISLALRKKTHYVIPDGIEIIDCFAFLGCENVEEVTIPASVKYIGERAFCDCSDLKKVNLPDTPIEIAVQLNDLFDK